MSSLARIFMKIGQLKIASQLTLLTAVISLSINAAFADVSVVDVSPAANDVSEQAPAAPARMSLFAWQGTAGSQYSIRFSIDKQPSLVVGVGADVKNTSFDSSSKILTVVLSYNGDKILADENISLPDNSFLVVLDPGIDGTLLPFTTKEIKRNPSISGETVRNCYGPGAHPELYADESGDFGDDDGLNDPESPSEEVSTVGLPQEAAGTFASTNVFYWCVVPPQGSSQSAGLRLLADKDSRAKLQFNLSQSLIDYMGLRLNRTINSSNLAIFSDDFQVGVDVSNTGSGAAISVSLPVNSNSTVINPSTAALVARATTSSSLDKRTITVGVKEPLTLAPNTLQVVNNKVIFTGFIDDLSLVGQFVEILRIDPKGKCGIDLSAIRSRQGIGSRATTVKGTIIARSPVQSDGSYSVKVPASAIFNGNSKTKVVARIPGDSTKTSREVSLSNRNRDLRQ